jgi:hypothetical protein
MVVSDVLRTQELEAWFLTEHLVETPLVKVKGEVSQAAD